MRLRDAGTRDDIVAVYGELGFPDAKSRIGFLRTAMGVECVSDARVASDGELLAALERHCLEVWDRRPHPLDPEVHRRVLALEIATERHPSGVLEEGTALSPVGG